MSRTAVGGATYTLSLPPQPATHCHLSAAAASRPGSKRSTIAAAPAGGQHLPYIDQLPQLGRKAGRPPTSGKAASSRAGTCAAMLGPCLSARHICTRVIRNCCGRQVYLAADLAPAGEQCVSSIVSTWPAAPRLAVPAGEAADAVQHQQASSDRRRHHLWAVGTHVRVGVCRRPGARMRARYSSSRTCDDAVMPASKTANGNAVRPGG